MTDEERRTPNVHSDSKSNQAAGRIKSCLDYSLLNKYGIENNSVTSKILNMQGLAKENLDIISNFEVLLDKGIADSSIDQNANKGETSINGLFWEAALPAKKNSGFRYLYRKMAELYGKKKAKFLSGEMYDYSLILNDSTNILLPYCFSANASRLVLEGRPWGQLESTAPHRIDSYISALNETVHQLSNHQAGALAVGSLFLDIAHLMLQGEKKDLTTLKTDKEYRKKMANEYQKMIHGFNSLSRNGGVECPFTNVSVMDKSKLQALLDEENFKWYFDMIERPAEAQEMSEKEWIDYCIDVIYELQLIFLDVMNEGDAVKGGMPFRFPVVSLNISVNDDWEIAPKTDEFIDEICKRDIFRFNIYVSKGMKIASCCFDKDEKCLIKDNVNGVQRLTFEEAYNTPRNGTNFSVYHNGYFLKGKPVKINLDEDRKMYKITTSNNKSFIVTDNHINVTDNGDKKTSNLTVNDYLMFNTTELKTKSKNQFSNEDLSYDLGVLIGAYLGDGSCYVAGENKGQNRITFSLNLKKDKELIPYFESALKELDIKSNITINEDKNNCSAVTIASDKLYSFIKEYVHGGYAYDKSLDMKVLDESLEFRQGILKGHYLTDGGNSNRIYSVSAKLIEDMETLINSLGLVSTISMTDRTDKKVVIREEEFNRNYPLYCIRWYEKSKRAEKDIYKQKNGNYYFKITSIEEVKNYKEKDVYCFEMKNEDEPYFTLPNGLITHNCRLVNDSDMFSAGSQVNSFGGNAISLGSHRVVTLNLNRIALESKSEKDFFDILEKRCNSAGDILVAHRHLLQDLIDIGKLPFMKNGWLELDRMFSTIGLLGYYEADKSLKKRFGDKDYMLKILEFIDAKAQQFTKEKDGVFNVEQIPAESQAWKTPIVDKLLFPNEEIEDLYSNQFLPVFEDFSLWDRMSRSGLLDTRVSGGSLVHFNIGEKITNEQSKLIIYKALESRCSQFALNSVYSECENEHTFLGDLKVCPKCGGKITEQYTRTVGFFTPVSTWAKRKKEEDFAKRTYHTSEETVESLK